MDIKPKNHQLETLDLSAWWKQKQFTFDYEINNIKLDNVYDKKKKNYHANDDNKNLYNNSLYNINSNSNINIDTSIINSDHLYNMHLNDINDEEQKGKNGLNTKMYYYDFDSQGYRIINYNNFKDALKVHPFETPHNSHKANLFKRLVSKKKRRLQTVDFDLDMAYITERVIAMGYPSYGCEKAYRNSVADVILYFRRYHKDNVKIYNLCLEKDRIYNKSIFGRSKVALFPSNDHNPCPVKLILEFCVDIVLFLTQNFSSVAAVHCKAGKGRTGLMICCYLFFTGLCSSVDECLSYYGKMRTFDGRGVTIPSQIRYIRYFETFLNANFYAPYIYLIPKIIREHIYLGGKQNFVKNLLINLQEDERYFKSPNSFKVNWIKIGPLKKEVILDVKIETITKGKKNFPRQSSTFSHEKNGIFFIYYTNDDNRNYPFHSDIKIVITKGLKFYICMNLWYSSLEEIDRFIQNDGKSSNFKSDTNVNNNKSEIEYNKNDNIKKSQNNDIENSSTVHNSNSDLFSKLANDENEKNSRKIRKVEIDVDSNNIINNIKNNINNSKQNINKSINKSPKKKFKKSKSKIIRKNTTQLYEDEFCASEDINTIPGNGDFKKDKNISNSNINLRSINSNSSINNINYKKDIKSIDDGKDIENIQQFINDFNPVNKNGFLVFNEDRYALSSNTKQGLNDILDGNASVVNSVQHGSDLNSIIKQLNDKRKKNKKSLFDKNNVSIFFTYEKLDKFKQKKTMKDIIVEINYSIK